MYPKKFENLINSFNKLPGVGRKTAERYAYTALEWDQETITQFIDSLSDIKNGIHFCKVCGNMCEDDLCDICKDSSRNMKIICVVENSKNLEKIEEMQEYRGVYHILNGTINVKKGVMPENLNIDSLMNRIDDNTQEVILALDPTIEGETTSLYLSKLIDNKYSCKVTKLAHGIPLGGKLDYTDNLTLLKAFEKRSSE